MDIFEFGYEKLCSMADETEKVIVGKRKEIELLFTALLSGGHVLIEDIPGTGKTTLAEALSKVCGLSYNRAQFTPDVTASDITGFNMYNRHTEKFEFVKGLAMCNILLADEINRAAPRTQSALLEAMEERKVTVDGTAYQLPDPFFVIATQNPCGFVGTYPLPEAQLDRFSVRMSLGYPSFEDEIRLVADRKTENPLSSVNTVSNEEEMRALIRAVSLLRIDERIYRYIVSLVTSTRSDGRVEVGASPRASIVVSKMAQARAFMNGRRHVIPDDVASVFLPAVTHRITVKRESRLEGVTAPAVLGDILNATPVPSVRTVR